MLLKLAALGALGYVGYRYYQSNGGRLPMLARGSGAQRPAAEPDQSDPRVAMAGGPLSEQAMVVEPNQLPTG